jgi:hypothetical protein
MNTKNFNARRSSAGAFISLLICALGFLPGTAQAASPADQISHAVLAAGATSVADASAKTFIQGFSSVIVRPKCDEIGGYVTAAVKLRPDLVSAIAIAAIRAHHRNSSDLSCDCVDPIIRAAILAAPDAKKALVRAAIDSEPWARECIVSASGLSRDTETAFFRPPGVDAGNVNGAAIGTINPANVGAAGQGNVNTPENDATTICHNGQTIVVSRSGAEGHIRNHPNDHLGPCGP